MKPKEFSLHEEGLWYGTEELPPTHKECMFHVIEKSAYDQALKDMESIAKALEYYDNAHRLHWAINFNDLPEVAFKALNIYRQKYGDKK